MYKSTGFRIRLLFISVCVFLSVCAAVYRSTVKPAPAADAGAAENTAGGAFKFFIASDTHYLSKSLYDADSDTFKNFVNGGDGKLTGYSDDIFRAFANDAVTQKPNAVIISGDLTLNGEKASHTDLAKILKEIEDAGIEVLVIPGNHDINNPFAREIRSQGFYKTDYVTSGEFTKIYKEFGYGGALSYDEHSLSYISRLTDGLYVLMLDACMYGDNIESNASYMGGRIGAETAEWIEGAVNSITAEDREARIITVMHHNLFVHNRNFEFNYVIYSAAQMRERLGELGLKLFFSGHIHIQDILSADVNGSTMTEVVNGALVTYPIAYGVAEVAGDELNYYTQWVDMEAYAHLNNVEDSIFFDFKSYAEATFTERSGKRMEQALRELDCSEEDIEAAVNALKLMNTYYFAGNIDLIADELMASRGYGVMAENSLTDNYIKSVFEDGGGENNRLNIRLSQ